MDVSSDDIGTELLVAEVSAYQCNIKNKFI